MQKILCDRCKRDISNIGCLDLIELYIKNGWAIHVGFKNNVLKYNKTLCQECANDIMNYIDYECDSYKLNMYVEVKNDR